MSITYKDIENARIVLQEKYQKRRILLQNCAQKLLVQYKKSLKLEREHWDDKDGYPRDYVQLGVLDKNDVFTAMSSAALTMDGEHRLSFAISTVTDDRTFTGGSYYLVTVSMYMLDGALFVEVARSDEKMCIGQPDDPEAYNEICSLIKQVVIKGLTDHRLD